MQKPKTRRLKIASHSKLNSTQMRRRIIKIIRDPMIPVIKAENRCGCRSERNSKCKGCYFISNIGSAEIKCSEVVVNHFKPCVYRKLCIVKAEKLFFQYGITNFNKSPMLCCAVNLINGARHFNIYSHQLSHQLQFFYFGSKIKCINSKISFLIYLGSFNPVTIIYSSIIGKSKFP